MTVRGSDSGRREGAWPLALSGTLNRAGLLLAACVLASCSFGPGARDEIASYDFGPPPAAPAAAATPAVAPNALKQPLLVNDTVVPPWMDTPAIYYRLAYQDASRPRAYSASRWMMPPSTLFTNRLRQRLVGAGASSAGVLVPVDGLRAGHALRVEIEEFTQVFDAPGRSRAVLRARATLLGSRTLVAQRTFSIERAAATADAEGGVRALIAASDDLIAQLLEWTVANAKN